MTAKQNSAKRDIAADFESWFGKQAGSGVNTSFRRDSKPRKGGNRDPEKLEKNMQESMARLRLKRERLANNQEAPKEQKMPDSFARTNAPARKDFRDWIEQSVSVGELNPNDEKDVAMFSAIEALRKKRATLPPVPREKRTR